MTLLYLDTAASPVVLVGTSNPLEPSILHRGLEHLAVVSSSQVSLSCPPARLMRDGDPHLNLWFKAPSTYGSYG